MEAVVGETQVEAVVREGQGVHIRFEKANVSQSTPGRFPAGARDHRT
jgi:hypothetical protein